GRLAGAERSQALELVGPVAGGLSQQERPADGSCPEAVGPAQQGGERLAQLLGTKGLVREQRQLPPVERLGKVRIVVGRRYPCQYVGGKLAAERVEPRWLAR